MKIKLSKIEVAEIQLNEAIYLFFDKAHPIIIETLIGATLGILRDIGKTKGVPAPFHDSDKIKEEHKGTWISHIHKAQIIGFSDIAKKLYQPWDPGYLR